MEPLQVETNAYEHVETNHLTLDHVIAFLHSLKQSYVGQETALIENKQLKLELEQLQQQHKQLEQQFTKLQKENEELREDYGTMARIINRARQIEISEDEFKAPIFKMDRNGNLEKLEKIAE
jgi:prespore-specific regulator